MFRLWNLAKTYHVRPSELLGVPRDDGLTAFHLDYQVWNFGTSLDNALKEATEPTTQGKKVKPLTPAQQHLAVSTVLEKWLGVKGIKKYRDPAIGRGGK